MARILIVEDDPQVRLALTSLLAGHGHAVLTANEGAQALALLRTHEKGPPRLAIVDLVMPGVDGIGFIQEARQSYPDLRIIALTGGGSAMPPSVSLPLASASGADAALMKPVTKSELMDVVNQLLHRT